MIRFFTATHIQSYNFLYYLILVLLVNEAFSTYFLRDGENYLSLGRYEIGTWGQLAKKYRATIRINGDLAAFIRRYPGSYLAVANSTTE